MQEVRVLLADDQAEMRRLLGILLLRQSGWSVVEAVNGKQAIALYERHAIDLAVLDQRMPERTGTEVARHLRQDGFTGPILLFSAYLEPDLEQEAQTLGLVTVAKSDIGELISTAVTALGEPV